MNFIEYIKEKTKKDPMTVLLPEYKDDRMYLAADALIKEKLVKKIVMCGDPDFISKKARELNTDITAVEVIPIKNDDIYKGYTEEYLELRKAKGMTEELAAETMKNELFFGAMLVKHNKADGMVAGAMNTTADVIRAGLQIIGTQEGIKTVSSFFVMVLPEEEYGEKGVLFYADCGVVMSPTPAQLADIAVCTAKSAKGLMDLDPRIALLSFSTKGSAKHPSIDKVLEALRIVKEQHPELNIDGELQGDAALVERVAKKKVKESSVAGKANLLIFPDLDAGNIAYKLTQYLAKAEAYGPIIQGLAKPVNDLSRGCVPNDIVIVSCILQQMCRI